VFIPEANLALEAGHACVSLNVYRNITCLTQTKNRRPGVLTTEENKKAYVERLQEYLAGNQIAYTTPFVSVSIGFEKAKETFEQQLRQFRRFDVVPEGLRGTVYRSYTGRADEEGRVSRNRRDDIAIAAGMLLYWSKLALLGVVPTTSAVYRTVVPAQPNSIFHK